MPCGTPPAGLSSVSGGTRVKPVGDNRPVPERGAQIGCPADIVILLSSQDQHGDHQVSDGFFDKIDAKLGQ